MLHRWPLNMISFKIIWSFKKIISVFLSSNKSYTYRKLNRGKLSGQFFRGGNRHVSCEILHSDFITLPRFWKMYRELEVKMLLNNTNNTPYLYSTFLSESSECFINSISLIFTTSLHERQFQLSLLTSFSTKKQSSAEWLSNLSKVTEGVSDKAKNGTQGSGLPVWYSFQEATLKEEQLLTSIFISLQRKIYHFLTFLSTKLWC